MKYVIIIPDGAADFPLDELDGKTPFEAADIPHTDQISVQGQLGTTVTTPKDMPCGSDVCSMSLLGYDPTQYHKGRAPLEAVALGIELTPTDWTFRVNLVTVIDGVMQDHSAGHIGSEEGNQLLTNFAQQVNLRDMIFYPGISYRNIMVDTSAKRDWSQALTTPPHDIPGEPIRKHLPTGNEHTDLLQKIIAQSETYFARHELNQVREQSGKLPVTHLWPWGQGQTPIMPSFESRHGLRGAMITAVDLLAGIAQFIGWDRLDVPGQTSYHDTDYAAAAQHAIAAMDRYDLICIHIEAPDEASHAADASTKIAAIEAIDQSIVGPVHQALQDRSNKDNGYRLLYLPDHYTCVGNRKHDPTPVPFAMCGHRVQSVLGQPFAESRADASALKINSGHKLMGYFLQDNLS